MNRSPLQPIQNELQPEQLAQDGLIVESPEMLDAMIGVGDPSLVSSRKLSLRGCKWRYRGEGNANLVIALPQKEVMRLHKAEPRPKVACDGVQEANKCPSEAELSAEARERERVCREVLFCRRVMVPLVGACYLRPPVVAKLDSAEVQQINYLLQSQRPAHRHHKEVLCAGGHMTLHPDYALLPSNLADPDPTVATYCVEVKPKQGWIPHHNRFLSKCTYCTKQFLKLKNQSIAVRSSYCPLDLFSGNTSRMKEALQALLETPQNNLKIFKNGVLVYGDDLGGYDSLFEILHSWFGSSNKSLDKLGLLNCFYEVVIEALTRDLSDGTLMHVSKTASISRTHYKLSQASEFISKDVQKLRNVAAPILQPPCDQNSQELPTNCVLERILNLQMLEQSQNDSEVITSPCPKKDYAYVGAVICDPGTYKTPLHRYLLAATAKDCSILLAFQQVNNERAHSLPRRHIARQAGNGQLYVFNVGVSDLDPKPVSCIEKHKQRDQEILLACAELATYNREMV